MNPGTLLLLAILAPLFGGLGVWLLRNKLSRHLGLVNLLFTALSFILLVFVWFGLGRQAVTLRLPGFMGAGLSFELNALTLFFALLFSGAWVAASVYSLKYIEHEGGACRFYCFLLLTLSGCLGVVLAADLITLFLFFEMMTFCSYVLVIHKEDEGAMKAGNLYLFLGVIGGLILLIGIFLLYHATGTADFIAVPQTVARNRGLVLTLGICFMIGFGIKAGMAPLHIWLPQAHPVAPTPASALLSGIMIKTGAYGLFRVFYSVLAPAGEVFGWIFLALGLITMLLGAFLALQQNQAKRTLAYSSVSQIGYIIMGLGAALLPFGKDLYGVSGMLFHILNHAVFKTTLFMSVGALYIYTHTLDLDQLGGLLWKYPGVSFSFIIAALGITGMPGFNGYGSKTLLHHALTDLYHSNPIWPLWLAEKLFVLASALTICYFIKLFVKIFLGEKDWHHLPGKMAPALHLPIEFGALAVAVIGLFPHQVINAFLIPGMEAVGFDHQAMEYLAGLSVWNWHDLAGMGVTIAVAGLALFLIVKYKLDSIRFPQWLSVERLVYIPLARGFIMLCLGPAVLLDDFINRIYIGFGKMAVGVCTLARKADHSLDKFYRRAGDLSRQICVATGGFDQGIDAAYGKLSLGSLGVCLNLDSLDENLDALYRRFGLVCTRAVHKADALERKVTAPLPDMRQALKTSWFGRLQGLLDKSAWNLGNLNIESLIVAVALVLIFIIFIFWAVN